MTPLLLWFPLAMATPGGVEIAAMNLSAWDFEDLAFHQIEWGDLEAGEVTEFTEVERAYWYTRVSFTIDGVPFLLQPIDYVGEEPLDPGRYIYVVWVTDPVAGPVFLDLLPLTLPSGPE